MMKEHSNQLAHETSPYLRQHAHNPVNWYPWGEEALGLAKKEDKPILVSIGYSACHWCHVMEKESFENEETAEIMNAHFINIKIDREERPDLDQIYMDAVQAMTGGGGWPLNVFLTPDVKPFYGGTYFPPERAYNRSSWKETLIAVSNAFREKRNEIEAQAENLTKHILQANAWGFAETIGIENKEKLFTISDIDQINENILKPADKTWGGFGNAPKFPQTFLIRYLLRHHHYTGNTVSLEQACLSLDKMINGGIYDQVGGGFARYSTDSEWLVPHFEKMLYDNALIVVALSEAFQLTGRKKYKAALEETLKFVMNNLFSDEGGFYAAMDADSEGEEGRYYVWSRDEIQKILRDKAALFCDFYNVSTDGNWQEPHSSTEGRNILHINRELQEFADEHNLNEDILASLLRECRKILLEERNKRVRPGLDDKIILGWNALMNVAFSYAFSAALDERLARAVERNLLFMLEKFRRKDGGYFHTYKGGQAKIPAFLDDYAFLIQALIKADEITSDHRYLFEAKNIAGHVIEYFHDPKGGMFFYTPENQPDLIVRKKEIFDGAIPSGNSVMANNLYQLSVIFNRRDWRQMAAGMTEKMREVTLKYPTSFGFWAINVQTMYYGVNEFAVIGEDYRRLRNALNLRYIPNKVLLSSEAASNDFELLKNRDSEPGETFIFHCKDYSCHMPVKTVNSLGQIL